jgi:MFS family permease
MNFKKYFRSFIENNFHALMHKNFRYYWIGQCMSVIGTWIQSVGQSWLVLSLTGSPFLLGVIGTMQFLPITLFSLVAGVAIDRFPKKKILLITQSLSMILAFTMSALVFTHSIKYYHIVILALLLGCINTIDMPTRQSFIVEIAGKKDLMNAIALNSATFNLARIIGPAIGALLMAYIGIAWCFFINGLSFLTVLCGLIYIEVKPYVRKKVSNNIFKEIKDGLKYVLDTPALFETVCMVTVIGVFVFNYNILIPVFTKNILHQQEKIYGFLMSSLGVGSLIGAVMVSLRSKSGPKKLILFGSSIITAIMLIFIGFSRTYHMSAIFLAVNGLFNIYFSTTANSTLQVNSKDEYRGRVMSVYSLVFAGSAPLGSLFSGYVAGKIGSDWAFIVCGSLTLICVFMLMIMFKIKGKS